MSNFKYKIGDVVRVFHIAINSCNEECPNCMECVGRIIFIYEKEEKPEEFPYIVKFNKDVCQGLHNNICAFNVKEITKVTQKESDRFYLEKYKYV